MVLNKVTFVRIIALAVILASTGWQPVRAEDSIAQRKHPAQSIALANAFVPRPAEH